MCVGCRMNDGTYEYEHWTCTRCQMHENDASLFYMRNTHTVQWWSSAFFWRVSETFCCCFVASHYFFVSFSRETMKKIYQIPGAAWECCALARPELTHRQTHTYLPKIHSINKLPSVRIENQIKTDVCRHAGTSLSGSRRTHYLCTAHSRAPMKLWMWECAKNV